jgi:DNA-binding MarR family transcriptional regulator
MPPINEIQAKMIMALRHYGGTHNELTRAFAKSLGLHHSDAAALVEIIFASDRHDPISPAKLSSCIGLSRAATSALLDRLEAAGHVTRVRSTTDKRRVTLHNTPAVQAHAEKFFVRISEEVSTMMAPYSEQLLQECMKFVLDFSEAIDRVLAETEEPQ